MDIPQKINALESKIAELQSQLASGDEKVALLYAIASKDYQLTELYKHLPSRTNPAGISSFIYDF